jgi:uncharacterized protein involved in exopolysaccharide biosynthesis
MFRHRRLLLLGSCAVAGIAGLTISNAETVTYSYDALGRLRGSSVVGGPDTGTSTAICYDPASNRERYVITKPGGATCTTSIYPPSAPLPTRPPSP